MGRAEAAGGGGGGRRGRRAAEADAAHTHSLSVAPSASLSPVMCDDATCSMRIPIGTSANSLSSSASFSPLSSVSSGFSPSFHFLSPTFSPAIRGRTGVVIMTQKCSLCGRKFRKVLSQSGVIKEVRKSDIFTPAGRPTDVDFERAVFEKIADLDKCRSQESSIAFQKARHPLKAIVSRSQESSIAFQKARHPLKAIVIAGIQTAQEEPFCNRKYVKSLKFSKCWASGLLRRQLQQKQQQQQSERTS
jgi:hypothetical protein